MAHGSGSASRGSGLKILVVKMSSLGDIIHTLPAISDAAGSLDDVSFDWVVEEAFAPIPQQHPSVEHVVPIALRRWTRRSGSGRFGEAFRFIRRLRQTGYDLVIDAQGLLKSAVVAGLARGTVAGLDAQSAREPISRRFYHEAVSVPRSQHAVTRVRQLFAGTLGYEVPAGSPDYGLSEHPCPVSGSTPRIMLLHGTTWASKHWPDECWRDLAHHLSDAGYEIVLTSGSEREGERAKFIVRDLADARLLPQLPLADLMGEMALCSGMVSVDSGLGHLAVAMDKPVVGIYGATNATLTGMYGSKVITLATRHLPCAPCLRKDCQFLPLPNTKTIFPPCYEQITPERVASTLIGVLSR